MKKIVLTLVLISAIHCKAQSPIIDIVGQSGPIINNAYYKDVNNVLNTFEGTWQSYDPLTNSTLKIVLVKKQMMSRVIYFEDVLIGEYQFIANGDEVLNTLNNINTVYPTPYHHKIAGNYMFVGPQRSPFTNSSANEIRVDLHFTDNCGGGITIRKTTVNGTEAIEFLRVSLQGTIHAGQQPKVPIVREGFYTLLKI